MSENQTAYFGDEKLRQKYIRRAQRHRRADQLVQSFAYWADNGYGEFKGCAVGCLSHKQCDAHEALEVQTGLPASLSWLADKIFEGLGPDDFPYWPERYAAAAKAGSDLSKVHHRFFVWVFADFLKEHLKEDDWREVKKICQAVVKLHQLAVEGQSIPIKKWESLELKTECLARASIDSPIKYVFNAASRASYYPTQIVDKQVVKAVWFSTDLDDDAIWKILADKLIELMSNA